MSYAGNPSLAPEVQRRILDTFRHSLDVAASGSVEEARLGCDFILQLDPLFTPATALNERLSTAHGAVAVADLRAALGGASTDDIPTFELPATDRGGGAVPGLRADLQRLLDARDYPGLMSRAQGAQAAIAGDPELGRLLGQAQELMEAAPYVDKFLAQARAARAAGRADEARSLEEKARRLDPGHPALRVADPGAAAPTPRSATLAAETATAMADADTELPPLDVADLSLDDDTALPLDLPPLELPEVDAPAAASFADVASRDEPPRPEARVGGTSDADPRIAELLDEGQALYARGELQGAIDAWSRIFLIDIDHQEAARRIDDARNAKAEQERQAEEAYHEALAKVQAKDIAGGKQLLQRVLQVAPNHAAARDALAKLERGEVADLPKPPGGAGDVGMLESLGGTSAEELKEEILVPPEPAGERARAEAVTARPASSRRTLVMAAAAVLLVVLAGVWYASSNVAILKSRWSSLFPNTEAPVSGKRAVEQTPVTRATELYKQGKRAIAIAQLKRVPPASPYYEEAQALIGKWEQEEAAAAGPTGPSPEQQARRAALMAQVQQAASERRFLTVGPLLDQAAAIAPLNADEQHLRERAQKALEPLKEVMTLLHSEEYDRSLRQLWTVLDKDSANADARFLLSSAYYNKGVLSLQQGKPADAETNLKEAANLTPADTEVQRLLLLAQTYKDRTPDLLYNIFTKYLNPRSL